MPAEFDVAVVGAGFAGLYALHRLRAQGLSAVVLEAADGVGGTWYWNRYPGARCDVDSVEYCYSFSDELQQDWRWSERYAAQPEILRYLEHVADRFDLRRSIRFGARVVAAEFDERRCTWAVTLADGDRLDAHHLVMATGPQSVPHAPLPGIDRFAGDAHHTGRWPHAGLDLAGKRAVVVGTGSSAVQAIPLLAEAADEVVVLQRTPAYTLPARNRPLSHEDDRRVKADYAGLRARNRRMRLGFGAGQALTDRRAGDVGPGERRAVFEEAWRLGGYRLMLAFTDLVTDPAANEQAADFVRGKVREVVDDPATADRLSPRYAIGCKRVCLETGYLDAYNRGNVRLVDVSASPIVDVTPGGVRTADGHVAADCLVLATGFDSMTGALTRIDVRGRDGRSLRDAWAAGPANYLGLAVPGFPNLFTICGPGSPSVLTNVVVAIEQHVDWVVDCIGHLDARGHAGIEATPAAAARWVAHVADVAAGTLYPTCDSWYVGANVAGKPRAFMPYPDLPAYVERCERVAATGYEGFALLGASAAGTVTAGASAADARMPTA